jgi:2-methylcitrate dehydratase PrpD
VSAVAVAARPRPVTRELAAWIAGLRYDGVPAETRAALKAALLDTLAAAIYGGQMEWSKIVREWAAEAQPRTQRASAWGEPAPTLRAADAALTNGVAAHALELDDYHNAKVHPGAAVIPAALALAEALDLDGVAVMTAIAAGYETMIRTALALGPIPARLHGWHLTGVTGTLGAAAAAASLLGLDAEHTTWALGLAGTQSAGLFAFNADGAMSKRIHAGRAAHAGVFAAEIAARGYTGPTSVYEFDDGGILKTFAHSTNVDALVDGLGTHWASTAVCFKPYSCCGSNHSSIDAARTLRGRFGPAVADAPIRVGVSHAVRVQCGMDYVPSTEMLAQMSLRYCVAAALLDGNVLPPQFTPERFSEERIVALAQRIELIDDPQLDELYPVHFAGWVEAVVDGKPERVFVNDPLGSPFVPLDRDGVADKARGLLGGLRSAEAIRRLEQTVDEFEGLRARDLIAALAAAQ